MEVQLLVFIYIYISVSIILFNLIFTNYQRYHKQSAPQRLATITALMEMGYDQQGKSAAVTLQKHLKSLGYLVEFNNFLDNQRNQPEFQSWLRENLELFLDLELYYYQKPAAQRSFYAYILSRLAIGDQTTLPPKAQEQLKAISAHLTLNLDSQSVYLRENALKAIINLGTASQVVKSLQILQSQAEHLQEKLLTAKLLSFPGNHQELAAALWGALPNFGDLLQIVLVNYLRLLPKDTLKQSDYFPRLYKLLLGENTNKELRLVILRYFRKYRYGPVYSLLITMVKNYSYLHWEYTAIAASSLANYPSRKTIRILKKALACANWYVRFNASESLIDLGMDLTQLLQAAPDSYGEEMLMYRLAIHKMKNNKKSRN